MVLNGKENFTDRPKVLKLIEAFERAYNNKDDLALAIIATRLKREHNVNIVADNKEDNNDND